MDNFNDIKSIWHNQPDVPMPSLAEVTKEAQKSKSKMIKKNIIGIVLMSATLLFIGYLCIAADFKYVTTKIGMIIIIIAIIGSLIINTQLLTILLNAADNTNDNNAYLKQLIRYRNKQGFMQKTGMIIYFILLSLGLVMYMFEFFMRDKTFGIVAYFITLAWIAFNWFYIRPKTIKKQVLKTNDLISQMENISKQYVQN